ncbi:hypothetical protein XENTR_v10008154 [Xenopus tropicalis]|uniref:Proheparin-binding EGF-like growth factor n=1 Tax=Xenopus tropicalis TaxID=8364 RepID=A0A6I8QCY1_XENTR|nr:proheparin-binding EGF-like growth factor [Xenopus tropicalis]KAE8614426.1 hypothetical protein XENTR_v10008154 [Xenopus tropicalis]|eukprot:XP_002937773.1 PREDICTED: proheparin-binding EGF-like growth factor [Xenopus tropicalis]
MNFMKLALLLLLQVSYVFVYGAVIGAHQNEVFSKATSDFAPAGESFQYEDKRVFTVGNHIVASPRAVSPSKPLSTERQNKGQNSRGKKGKGRKRDPCKKKYKDYCIHGECRYIKAIKAPSCVCQTDYHGERCHALTLPLENPLNPYDHTTVLAVVAVVLSSVCLIIISSLLILRYHKRGAYNVENEEKLKLGNTA